MEYLEAYIKISPNNISYMHYTYVHTHTHTHVYRIYYIETVCSMAVEVVHVLQRTHTLTHTCNIMYIVYMKKKKLFTLCTI